MGLASKDALPPWASSGCAVAAAAAATVVTTPIDLAKTRLQTMRVGGVGNIESGVFGIMRDVVRREGVGALWTGASARVLAIAPGSAVSFYVYESIKDWCTREEE
jgi:solute carrier family 25 citrate transporter 1